MTEPTARKTLGTDPQNEINPAEIFAGYQALAPLGGDRAPVMNSLQQNYDFEAAAPKSNIGDLVRTGPSQTLHKLG